jgi:putative transposase
MSGQHKVAWLCEALLVSRSGYYDWKERRHRPGPRQVETMQLRQQIREEFARSRQTYGSPRLAHAIGCPGRRNRIARLMRAERIFARQRSKYRVATTDSRHGGAIAPNRLPDLHVWRCDQVWVSDATGVLTGQGWLYLVAVLDVFSRRVVGWAMSPSLDAPLTIAALRMAVSQRRPAPRLILHSDRGSQFASAAYRQVLAQHGLCPSMSRQGNCYDNAFIESFWSSLKYELVYHRRFATFTEARTAIFEYIETFYNRTRLHSSLAYRSPLNFELQQTKINPYLLSEKTGQAQTDPSSCSSG